MTNLQTVAGSLVWAAIASALMLATFEPVRVDRPAEAQFASASAARADQAAL